MMVNALCKTKPGQIQFYVDVLNEGYSNTNADKTKLMLIKLKYLEDYPILISNYNILSAHRHLVPNYQSISKPRLIALR